MHERTNTLAGVAGLGNLRLELVVLEVNGLEGLLHLAEALGRQVQVDSRELRAVLVAEGEDGSREGRSRKEETQNGSAVAVRRAHQ